MTEFEVEIEFAKAAGVDSGEMIVEAFAAQDGVAGVSDHGNATVLAGFDAPSMAAATGEALSLAERLGWGVLSVTVVQADTWTVRQGFLPDRELESVSASEAAGLLGVSRQRVHQWLTEGRLPSTRVGYSHVIDRRDVDTLARTRLAGRRRD